MVALQAADQASDCRSFGRTWWGSEPCQNEQTEFPQLGVIGSFRRARDCRTLMGYCNGGTPEERDDNPCLRRPSARKR
jgi:hypothetical protein